MRSSRVFLAGLLFALAVPSGACRAQATLEEAAEAFIERWAGGDVGSLQRMFSAGGVRLQWGVRPLGVLDPQHAIASVREYLEGREGLAARATRVEDVGGDPPRGYAEIHWESRIRGTSEVVRRTVFVAFVSRDGVWRVTELRVLPRSRTGGRHPFFASEFIDISTYGAPWP